MDTGDRCVFHGELGHCCVGSHSGCQSFEDDWETNLCTWHKVYLLYSPSFESILLSLSEGGAILFGIPEDWFPVVALFKS